MTMNSMDVKRVSECFIKPKNSVQETNYPYYLTPWDLSMLSFHYIQKGLVFSKPNQEYSFRTLVESLKNSLSITLVHFYPLAGQFTIQTDDHRQECLVFVDCNKGSGAKFIQATLNLTVSDLISPIYVPKVVHSLFDHHGVINSDGENMPMLSVQVTELFDGVFIGCSINHAVVDGTSYWQFWNTWSKIHKATGDQIPRVLRLSTEKFPFSEGLDPEIFIPFTHPEEFVSRYETPPLRERFFHFSAQAISSLKLQANRESKTDNISSFQALTALVWKSVVKATCRPANEVTNCRLATNNRPRLDPVLPYNYIGNCVTVLNTSTTVGELLKHDLGSTALLLHQLVVNYCDRDVRDELKKWLDFPVFFKLDDLDSYGVTMSSSPRFDMYGNEFGLGKPVAVRSGNANKFPGGVTTYPGREGGGSVELEICLPNESMSALELDEDFMAFVSLI